MNRAALPWLVLGSLTLATACAPIAPPKELATARATYMTAKRDAKDDAPLELEEAHRALLLAEHRFEEIGAEPEVAGLGFVADRKAQRAMAMARKARLERELRRLEEDLQKRVKDREARALADAEAARLEAEKRKKEAEEAQRARKEAEEREASALNALRKLSSSVRAEPRGLVITFSGGVLFATNGAALTPAAKTKLDELVEVLQQKSPKATLLVEGHTDNTGTHAHNATLSKARADAVAAYLVKKGVAKDRVRTEGVGETRPIASNAQNDGRATNRRVEIVVEK